MKTIVLCAAAAVVCCSGISLAQDGFPRIAETDIPGLHIIREAAYDGTSLWGYIDGGADVYLEYGFSKLLAQKVTAKGAQFQVDLYRMQNPESAFGIFSISAFKCALSDSLAGYQCVSRYQLQAARGDFYLSIVNDKGSDEAGSTAVHIAQLLLSRIDQAELAFPAIFELPDFSAHARSMKFMRGRLGIENGYPGWEDLFAENGMYSVYLLPVRSDDLDLALADIVFGGKEDANHFASAAGFHTFPITGLQRKETDGITKCLWRISNTRIVYLEVRAERHRIESLVSSLNTALTHK